MAEVRLADNLSYLHLFPLILQSSQRPLLSQFIYCHVNYHNPAHPGKGSSSRQEWDDLLGGHGLVLQLKLATERMFIHSLISAS